MSSNIHHIDKQIFMHLGNKVILLLEHIQYVQTPLNYITRYFDYVKSLHLWQPQMFIKELNQIKTKTSHNWQQNSCPSCHFCLWLHFFCLVWIVFYHKLRQISWDLERAIVKHWMSWALWGIGWQRQALHHYVLWNQQKRIAKTVITWKSFF